METQLDILILTEVFVNQKGMNVCENRVKMAHTLTYFPFPRDLIFKFWYRYVDDVIILVKKKIQYASELLNIQEKTLKLTMKIEANSFPPFF